MSDQLPERAAGPRKLSRGTLTVAVSAGLITTSSHGGGTALTGDAQAPAAAPGTPSSSIASSSPASSPTSSAHSLALSAPSRSAAASAPWSSTDCPSQLASWRSTGAGGQLQVVVTDATIATRAAASLDADLRSGTAPASAVTALSLAATSLRSSTRAATKNLIPGCVPGTQPAEVQG